MSSRTFESTKAQITSNRFVYIESIDEQYSFDKRVYAINWFNTRALWLYHLYTYLAKSQVKQIGGKGVFKGRVQEILYGNSQDAREMLLIVTYPKVQQFKKLFEMTSFKILSILRILAVKDFTFGLTRKTGIDNPEGMDDKEAYYAIHHYKNNDDISKEVALLAEDFEIDIFYSGSISALLYNADKHKKLEQIPCIMDGVIILKSEKLNHLKQLIQSDAYQDILDATNSSFVATLKRIF